MNNVELKPCDLDRFDKWAVSRGFADPRAYMAACEAFEAQQVIIDELLGNTPVVKPIPEKVEAIFRPAPLVVPPSTPAPVVQPKAGRSPGKYHTKRGANGRFS